MNIFETLELTELPTLIEIRNQYVNFVLARSQNKAKAAKVLGINRRTLYRRSLKSTQLRGYKPSPEVTV